MVISTQPPGFVDPALPDHVCLLQKSLYGLKQAPLFVYKDGASIAYLLLYVDDIVLTASSCALLHNIIGRLHTEFAMTDLGALHHFFGISVTCSLDGMFLSQRQYALDLLQRAGMGECHSTTTPVDTKAKLSATDGAPVADPSEYRSLAGALQYLTLTRPDFAYAVQQVCSCMIPVSPILRL